MSMVDRKARKRIQALEERAAQRDREVAELSSTVSRLAATIETVRASSPRPSPVVHPNPPTPAAPAGFASLIVADFPALFAEFRGKRFTMLWRGSRDGFGAREFHSRCDGHAPTLTLIQDTKGNIFGGFTPVEWESRTGSRTECCKADPSLKIFPFSAEESAQFPGEEICAEGRKEGRSNRM
jgi:hypothetical protein